ncbi:MAG TPA: 3-hydroxyacyl-CoA dehydrogenase NAD-binding domain-containing protein [Casimicrobiaceae bacterium]|nr:3-hydroxyacyl-CoA dehydrogenase NAD-binding domain-containing protein [Casimicrobiaceae bacterium]
MRHWSLTRDAEGIATLVFDKAGAAVNTLSADAMAEFGEALTALDTAPPKALVIRSGKANGFIAGADIDEFRAARTADDGLAIVRRGWDLFARLAHVPYPTLAVIKGFCLGGGLELAMACRYRVAVDDPSTRMGLPEVMLGIVPGWGGIQRLPRLVGAPAALDLLLTGKTIDARRARALGLVDEAVPPRIVDNTIAGMLRALPPPRHLPFLLALTLNPFVRKLIAASAAKKVAQRARPQHYPAPYTILALFARFDGNALAPPPDDAASMQALFAAPDFGNLIRVYTLQERLKALGKDGDAKARHVHVVGAGTMGGDIAAWCALRGLTVTLQDQDAARLAPAFARASKLFGERLRDPRRVRDASDRLIPDVAGDGIGRADVVIEAIFENVDAKRAVFAAVGKKARADAILATNTSSIPLEAIAGALADPSRLVGLHFFNPVAKMMLVEVVVGMQSAAAAVPRALAFVRQIDKLPLPVKSAPGFLVNRILAPYLMTAMRAVDEGLSPETVDEAALAFGMPMGPIELADTVGLDICVAVGKLLADAGAPPQRLMALVDAKKLGKKSGEGYYRWVNGKPQKAAPSAVPPALAARLIDPFVAEARKALAEGVVADADLVDAGAIFGTGFAPFRGGPLWYAAHAARDAGGGTAAG